MSQTGHGAGEDSDPHAPQRPSDARSDQSIAGARPRRRLTQYAAGGG